MLLPTDASTCIDGCASCPSSDGDRMLVYAATESTAVTVAINLRIGERLQE
jgi:hypothetical protein